MKREPLFLVAVILALGVSPAVRASMPLTEGSGRRTPIVAAVEKCLPSVVNIGTESLMKVQYNDPRRQVRGDLFDQFFAEFFAQAMPPQYQMSHSLGSGIVVDENGYILTNFHVIQRASKIRVALGEGDGKEYDAVFLAGDEVNDLALIKIDAGRPLRVVELAQDDDVMLGETVIAMGNPFGLSQTVTVGVLSSKSREARYGGEVLYRDILQTDAAVNPGSSGGPLLNINGELIGVNVAIYREAQNIGFAVPVKRARELLTRWLAPRLLKKTSPGFDVAPQAGGFLAVTAVDAGRSNVPVRVGDVIRTVRGKPVGSLYDFHKALLPVEVGGAFRIGLERNGQYQQAESVLSPLPKPAGDRLADKLLGMTFAASRGKGLQLSGIRPNSAAAQAGLQPGLWVTRVNDREITSLDDVGLALENTRSGDRVVMVVLSLVERGGNVMAQYSAVALLAE